jgi:hypothetical protein
MSYGGFPEKADEDRILNEISQTSAARQQYANGATPDLAQRIGDIYRANPWMKPGEILALAKAGASDQLVNAASTQSGKALVNRLDTKPQTKNWFERNVYDPAKAAARYTFASLNLAPELVQNFGSQMLNKNNPEGFDGWFKSTSLGTMLAASKGEIDPATGQPITAGEGFFLGGSAFEKQEERARQFRGTINDKGWTVGRGAANLAFAPGSKPYNFLSGIVDAAVNIFADPTLYGGKALKTFRAGRAAVPSLQTADEIAAFSKVARAGEFASAGLDQAEMVAWNGSKFRQWAETNGKAQRLIDTLVERDDAYDIFSNVFKGKIDVEEAARFAGTKNREEVLAILGEQANRMDSELSGLFPQDIREIVKSRDRIPLLNLLNNKTQNSRLLTKMPDAIIKVGSAEDRIKAVKSYGNFLKTFGADVTQGEGKELMARVMKTFADPIAAGADELNEVFQAFVKKFISDDLSKGLLPLAKNEADQVAEGLFAKARKIQDQIRTYMLNEAGQLDDFGLIGALNDTGKLIVGDDFNPANIANLRAAGPGALVELADKVFVLPDVRSVRRITSNPFMRRALSNRAGDQRSLLALTDYLQNEIWKPITLMTGGYIMRNMFDAQIRIAAVGLDGFFTHPIRYMMTTFNKILPEAYLGADNFDELITNTAKNFDSSKSKFQESMEFGLRRHIDDPKKMYERLLRNEDVITVNKIKDRPQYVEGLYEELRRLSGDQIDNFVAKGAGTDEVLEWVRRTDDPKAVEAIGKLRRYLEGGIDTIDVTTGKHHIVRIAEGGVNDEVLAAWVSRTGNPRIDALTGGDETLRFAMGHQRMPLQATETINPANLRDVDFVDGSLKRGVGSIVRLGDDADGPIEAVVTAVNGQDSWTIRRLSNFNVWNDDEGRELLLGHINKLYDSSLDKLPDNVKFVPKVGATAPSGMSQKELQALELKNRAVDFFFDGLYGRASRKFERSPVYRQFFYPQLIDNADLLSPSEAKAFLDSIPGRAQYHKMTPERLFGGQKQYETLLAKLNTANGTGTVKQLREYAHVRALQATKETLFNATERNNLEDILRIVIPFGSAWREIITSYGQFLVDDPTLIRKAQLVVNGATNFDPDNDGQGFFYKDPITGQNTFNLPFSGEFSKLLTGVNAPLQAPVKGLSMGLQVIPAVGPVVQIAASELLPDTPELDGIISILLPYGRKQPGSLVPGWMAKAYSALKDNENKLGSIYANTYGETVRALSASGEYELDNPAEKERLLQDAKPRARALTILRAASQFMGPTAGTPEALVATDQGDIYGSYLVKAFQELQQQNYDTAVQKFIQIYGDDALLYISSKTQAVQSGVEANDVFGDWERKNKDILAAYKDVAAYFAPGGDDFSYSVYERQIRTGQRKRLTASEMIDLAQYRVGNAIYRDLKRQAGKYPNEEVSAWLSRQRQKIHEKYPGFPARPVFTIGEFDLKIEQMQRAVADARLQNNPIAQAVSEYLGYRDKAIAQYVASGGKPSGFANAKAAAPLRQWLSNIGEALGEAEPDFQRVWDRELASEVDEL